MLIKHNIDKLSEIKNLLLRLPLEVYSSPVEILNEATIGQHFRHILEFYSCLEKGIENRTVSYDDRERDVKIESYINYALESIEKTIRFLEKIEKDFPLTLKANYSTSLSTNQVSIPSSLYRELAYAMDHTVHHLAIIKIALSVSKQKVELNENLGVAPSTIRYRKECVA